MKPHQPGNGSQVAAAQPDDHPQGQPRNTRAPIITNIPKHKPARRRGPAFARNSLAARAAAAAPTTMPMISGRMYCTLGGAVAAQGAGDVPQEAGDAEAHVLGLPEAVRIRAAMPTATPAPRSIRIPETNSFLS